MDNFQGAQSACYMIGEQAFNTVPSSSIHSPPRLSPSVALSSPPFLGLAITFTLTSTLIFSVTFTFTLALTFFLTFSLAAFPPSGFPLSPRLALLDHCADDSMFYCSDCGCMDHWCCSKCDENFTGSGRGTEPDQCTCEDPFKLQVDGVTCA